MLHAQMIFAFPVQTNLFCFQIKEKDIDVTLRSNLIEVNPDRREAIFQNLDKPEELVIFSLIFRRHPSQSIKLIFFLIPTLLNLIIRGDTGVSKMWPARFIFAAREHVKNSLLFESFLSYHRPS